MDTINRPQQDRLEQARKLIALVRKRQRLSGRNLRGGSHLPSEQVFAIAETADASHFVGAVRRELKCDEALNNLFERFEEMCRRRGIEVDDALRPYIIHTLAGELLRNHRALGGDAAKLIPFTLYNGALGPALIIDPKFAALHNPPWILRYAAFSVPEKTEDLLHTMLQTLSALHANPKFASLRTHPWVFTTVAAKHRSSEKAEAFVENALPILEELRANYEFSSLSSDWPFLKAVFDYSGDPKGYLRDEIARRSAAHAGQVQRRSSTTPGFPGPA